MSNSSSIYSPRPQNPAAVSVLSVSQFRKMRAEKDRFWRFDHCHLFCQVGLGFGTI